MNRGKLPCGYRNGIDCRFPIEILAMSADKNCELCLRGQTIESIDLLTSAIMERKIDKIEDNIYEPN